MITIIDSTGEGRRSRREILRRYEEFAGGCVSWPVGLPAMWDCTAQPVLAGRAWRYVPRRDGSTVPYRQVLRSWQEDEAFRAFFLSALKASEFGAYRFETPPVTAATAGRPFEFVLLDAPALGRATADPQPFADQFRAAAAEGHRVVTFSNLGNDAVLVVPCPSAATPAAAFAHLAAFVREAPAAQAHELWRAVGAAMEARVGATPTWLSTAGLGVPWLHVRLDSRPKYYGFEEYRTAG